MKVKCLICPKEFDKPTAEVKRYPNHCCSIACRSKFNDRRIDIPCHQCGTMLRKPPSLLKGKKNVFCSDKCRDESFYKQVDCVCLSCGTTFSKSPCYKERTRHDFCSPECSVKHRYKESYVETQFEKLIPAGVEYVRNDRVVLDGLELDFYFPKLKFAVEINGSTHYKPIYGEEKLAATKARDRRKRKMCAGLGIRLRVVKPGDCKLETFLPRYRAVIKELHG